MRVLKGAAIAVAILLALGLVVGCCLLAVTDAGAVLTVMQFVLLCALVFYAVLAVLALVKIAQNTDRAATGESESKGKQRQKGGAPAVRAPLLPFYSLFISLPAALCGYSAAQSTPFSP